MIPVTPQPEPADFDVKVRTGGMRFLQTTPNPTAQQFVSRAYWTEALPDLMRLYHENCAYSGLRLWAKSQEATVDHFRSKVKHPDMAYEWSNYRLCNRSINGWKRENEVVDPFTVQPDWFYLDFADLEVKVQTGVEAQLKAKLENDINILGLNKKPFVDYRFAWYERYYNGKVAIEILEQDVYFVACELKRQGITPHHAAP